MKSITHLSKSLLIICGLLLIASTAFGNNWGEVKAIEWQIQPPEEYPQADAIIIFDSCYVYADDFFKTGRKGQSEFRHVRKKIFTQAGIEAVSDVEISYHYKKSEIFDLKAHTIYPDGTVHEVSEDQMFTKKIEDTRVLTFAFPSLDTGVIVEYSYVRANDFLFSSYDWDFQSSIYTHRSVFTYEVGAYNQFKLVPFYLSQRDAQPVKGQRKRDPDMMSVISRVNKVETFTWRVKKLMPVRYEPYMGSRLDYTSRILVELAKYSYAYSNYHSDMPQSWPELGQAYHYSIIDYCKEPLPLKKVVRSLTKGIDSDYEKSKIIYQYVIDSINTSSNDFSFSYHNKNLTELFKKRNGNIFEKNLLLLTMLKRAKIKCWPVLISTRDKGKISPNIPHFSQFNHGLVFVEVEEGGIYLDASSKYNPYGTLMPQCRTELGLLLDKDKSELIRIITNEPKSYRLDLFKLNFDQNLKPICTLTCLFTGYMAGKYGYQYETESFKDFVDNSLSKDYNLYDKIIDHTSNLDSNNNFVLKMAVDFSDNISVMDNLISIDYLTFMFSKNPFQNDYRLFPIDFQYPFTYHHLFQIQFADSIAPVSLPANNQLDFDGVDFNRQAMANTDLIVIENKINILKPSFSQFEYMNLRELFKRIDNSSMEKITIKIGG